MGQHDTLSNFKTDTEDTSEASDSNDTTIARIVAKAFEKAVAKLKLIKEAEETESQQEHSDQTNDQGQGKDTNSLTAETAEPYLYPEISNFRKRFLLWDLVKRYPFNDDITNTGENYFMFMCSGTCGGWADQLKGTFFSYLIANLTGRRFKARFLKHTCGMYNYVIPNRVNWSIADSWKPNENESHFHNHIQDAGFKFRVTAVNFSNAFKMEKKYLLSLWNLDYVTGMMNSSVYRDQLSWMKDLTPADVIAAIYQHLFKLHPRLQIVLEKFLYDTLPTSKHRLVCLHVRLGRESGFGDFAIRNSLSNLPKIWSWVSNETTSEYDKIFLMSDSNTVIESAYNQTFADKLVTIPGAIVHINKFGGKNMTTVCEGIEKLILEHHVAMNCDVFVRGISGLSDIAAAVRGSDKGLYCLQANGTIEACLRNNLLNYK